MKRSIIYYKRNRLHRELTALAVLIFTIAGFLFAFSSFYDIGYKVIADHQTLGTVKEKSDYYLALSQANATIANAYGDEYVSSNNVTFQKSLLLKNQFSSESSLKQKAIASNEHLTKSYVINIDGTDVLSAKSKKTAEIILNAYKEKYRPQNCVELKFSNKIKISSQYAPKDLEKNEKSGLAVLESLNSNPITLDHMNMAGNLTSSGQTDSKIKAIKLSAKVQKISLEIVSIQKTQTEEPLTFTSTTVYNPAVYEDAAPVIKTPGSNGVLSVETFTTRVNNEVVKQVNNSEQVVKNPVNEVVELGSKKRPTGIGDGKFMKPVNGVMSSPYGPRKSGFHTGLDLAVPIGTPVKAADEGKVIFAGWDGNYGNLVIIDHQNGYQTYYAHNSSFNVKVGDIVAQGDIVAYSGSTGNSTGPHCHFEIRKNGATQDPYPYIF